jgi:short-subunit dehydrogenase
MKKQKHLNQQVIAVIGASSGIGLRVAQLAAVRGAAVALVSRSEDALQKACDEIRAQGGRCFYDLADVADHAQLQEAAENIERELGPIDTWIHNAGVGVWGVEEQIPLEEARRLFDVNFWGVVNGTRIATALMRERGGTIITMGSLESERAVPYHSFYAASKHAVKAYTETVRVEFEKQGIPIALTLIKPASIDTPFTEHARNYMKDAHPRLMPPAYDPDLVANAILECCELPRREVTIGGSGRVIEAMERVAPRLLDRLLAWRGFEQQERRDLSPKRPDDLFIPAPTKGRVRGVHNGVVRKTSLSTTARMHPVRSSLTLAAGLGLGIALWREWSRGARAAAPEVPGELAAANGASGDELAIDVDSISASGRREGDDNFITMQA